MRKLDTLLAAGALAVVGGAASAATLSFSGTGNPVAFGTGNYSAGPCAVVTECYNPSGPAAALNLNLNTFDAGTPGPGLQLDTAARITVTFLGKEAGATNYAFSIAGGSVSNLDTPGVSSYSTIVSGGVLDYAFKSSIGTLAQNGGPFTGSAAMGFSDIMNGGTTVYAYFDDSGAEDDRDYDDMVVRIDVSAIPVPAAGFLLLGGLGGFAAMKRRKKA